MSRRLSTPGFWQARLSAWPGLLTLLSVLAVLFGTQVPAQGQGERLSAGNVAPALPEARPAPGPSPVTPHLNAPAPEPDAHVRRPQHGPLVAWAWAEPARAPDLTALGRQQTDGG